MALYEFYCEACNASFEQITSTDDPEHGKCPKCQGTRTQRLISKFAVGGRGDLRESTDFHGCHPAIMSGVGGCGKGKCGGGHSHG